MTSSSSGIQFRKAEPRDYPGLLALQKENLISNLTEAEAVNGFLTVEYTEQQFDEINEDLGISVAVCGKDVLGYLCGSSFACAAQFPLLRAMIEHVEGKSFAGAALNAENTFVYGPVCIAASARGAGVLPGLFDTVTRIARPRYRACILFISGKNRRSLEAHARKLGMTSLGEFAFQNKRFHLFAASVG